MQGRMTIAVLGIALLITGCQDEPESSPTPVTSTTVQPVTSPPPVTPTKPPEVLWYGKRYSVQYSECAQKIWDGRVAEWNRLTSADRDRWSGADAWMKSKGWPVSHEATLLAPATRRACPPGQ